MKIDDKLDGTVKDKIIEFVKKLKYGIESNGEFVFGIVSKKEAEQIKKNINVNVEGYKRIFDKSGIKHVLKKHKNIKIKDFLLIPLIIKKYDFISCGNKPNTIFYKKLIGDEYFYVETIRKRRKKLALKTFYKREKRSH